MTKRLLATAALLTGIVCTAHIGVSVLTGSAEQRGQRGERTREDHDRNRQDQHRSTPDKVGLIQNDSGSFHGYTLLTPMMSRDTYLLDNDGKIINKWETDCPGMCAYLLKNGNLLRAVSSGMGGNTTFHGGGAGGRVQEFTWEGELVWDFEYSGEDYLLHHDIEPLPNGNVLMIAWERKTAEEAIDAGRDPAVQGDGDLWADHIIEVKPTGKTTGKTTGEIVWKWHVWDHLVQDLDSSLPNYGYIDEHPELIHINPIDWVGELDEQDLSGLQAVGYLRGPVKRGNRMTHPDWNHTNGISYNPELDQIALSVLGFNEVWIIDHSTTTEEAASHEGGKSGEGGDLLYRWGNPMAYALGTPEDQQLFAQHDATWVKRSDGGWGLVIFNNGRGRPDGDYSSVDEIVLPIDRQGNYTREPDSAFGPVEPAWSYSASEKDEFYSGHISGAQRLPNGNTLICAGTTGTLFEVTGDGETVWKYVNSIESMGPPGMGGFPGMDDLDPNGDGRLTFEEASKLPFMNEERFKEIDENGDGTINEEELKKVPPPAEGMFSQLDKDGDGQLQPEEASVIPFINEQNFAEFDENGDGSLSMDELPPPPGMGPGRGGPPGPPGRGGPPRGGPGRRGPGRGGPPGDGPGMGGHPFGGPGMGPPGMGGGPMSPRQVFKADRYALDYPGLSGKDLTPGDPIEANIERGEDTADR